MASFVPITVSGWMVEPGSTRPGTLVSSPLVSSTKDHKFTQCKDLGYVSVGFDGHDSFDIRTIREELAVQIFPGVRPTIKTIMIIGTTTKEKFEDAVCILTGKRHRYSGSGPYIAKLWTNESTEVWPLTRQDWVKENE